jgi:hypothetical protein
MALDRVTLVDIVATHPSAGDGIDGWRSAMAESDGALSAARAFVARRLPVDSPAGQCVLSVGAVAGGDEAFRGAVSPRMIHTPQLNPFIADVGARLNRESLSARLTDRLAVLSPPTYFPLVLIHCKRCQQVHHSECAYNSRADQESCS